MVRAGYKQTEVGEIPEDWKFYKIEGLISDGLIEKPLDGNHGNIHPKSSDFVDDGIPFVMANNFSDGKVNYDSCHFIRKEQADKLQKGFSYTGDVLLTHKGTVGNVAIVGETETDYIMLTPQVTYYRSLDTDRLSKEFIKAYFESDKFQVILKSQSGGGTRAYIGITKQRTLPFVLPPPNEQKAIAKALSDVDELIASLEKLIAKKRDIKTATMQQLLTGKKRLPGFGEGKGYKQTELSEIPEDWDMVELGAYARFLKGKGLAKSEISSGGDKKCIHYGELFTYYPEVIQNIKSRTHSVYDDVRSLKNDVLMPTSDVTPNGLATASCILEDEVILGGDVLIIRLDTVKIDGGFLSYNIRSSKNQIMQLVTGSTVYHLYGSDMAKFILPIPREIKEQQQIVGVLLDMDNELVELRAKLKKTKAIKQGMMQELLTGRTRLVEPQQVAVEEERMHGT